MSANKLHLFVFEGAKTESKYAGMNEPHYKTFVPNDSRKCPKVAVLSAFPMYVLDYYGIDTLKQKLGIA